jgi:hypothetical protein
MSEYRLHEQLDYVIALLVVIAGILFVQLVRSC